ncbi:ParB/RepB/Spo0J family partition protein, partial [Streptomyces sp. SBT349]|uniref:ParB/RepB/Spo0J family partition protein n=1 Tax=Streptomyces sp. SBT349 TaxID=1580539 RepID=UPI00131AD045
MPISTIVVADTPRGAGSSSAHARVLAETDDDLPPILLHRSTMRVIDGMHRLEAAKICRAETIRARFFDGDEDEAFVLAVESNVKHGLPLSLADRKAAALRIVRAHPDWSDRAVAAIAGLAHKTVGSIRRRASGEVPQLEARVGRDGRVRAVRTGPEAGTAAAAAAADPGTAARPECGADPACPVEPSP